MALGDERRASGRRMEAQRKAIGAAVRASRQSTFKQDLNALETSPRRQRSLRQVEPVGSRPAVMGKSYYTPPPSAGGGIASPLAEVEAAGIGDREFWPAMIQKTTDGLLTFEVRPIKQWKFRDAEGNPVVLNIAKPETI